MRPLTLLVTLALLLSTGPVLAAARPPVEVGKTWTRTDSLPPRFHCVAVLPAALVSGEDPSVPIYVADRWAETAPDVAIVILPGSECSKALMGVKLGQRPVLEVAADEVRRDVRLRESTARFLARALQADALMLIRIDRWDHQTGSKAMAYLDATATLVDSTGAPWWSSSCSTRLQSKMVLPMLNVPKPNNPTQPEAATVRTTTSSSSSGSSGSSGSTGSSGSSGSSGSGGSSSTSGTSTNSTPSTSYSTSGSTNSTFDTSGQTDLMRISSSATRIPEAAAPFQASLDSLFLAWRPLLPARK
jgi:uncharacterized membrane protein YgcG